MSANKMFEAKAKPFTKENDAKPEHEFVRFGLTFIDNNDNQMTVVGHIVYLSPS